MRATADRLVLLAFASSVALAGVTALSAHVVGRQVVEDTREMESSLHALRAYDRLVGAVVSGESSARGFAVTGDERFLEHLDEARASAASSLRQLRETGSGSAAERAVLERLESLVQDRFDRVGALVRLRRAGDLESAAAFIATGEGLQLTNAIRDAAFDGSVLVEARLAEAQRGAAASAARGSFVANLSLGAGLVVLALLLVLIRSRLAEAKAAREVAEGLARLVGASDEAIVGKSLDGVVRSWNGGAERLYGWSADEMIGASIERIVPAGRIAETRAVLARVGAGESVPPFETERVRKDGGTVLVSLSLAPVRDATGRVAALSSLARPAAAEARATAGATGLAADLASALDRLRSLQGLLPTCAWCKSIRDEAGQWQPMERFLKSRAALEFTHGICPGCAERLRAESASR